jgi:hypothetical protein
VPITSRRQDASFLRGVIVPLNAPSVLGEVVILAGMNNPLVRQQNYRWITVVEDLFTISRIPTMMRSDENVRFSQALAESRLLQKLFPSRTLQIPRHNNPTPSIFNECHKT